MERHVGRRRKTAVGGVGILRLGLDRHDDMLADPGRLHPDLLGLADVGDDSLGTQVGNESSELHSIDSRLIVYAVRTARWQDV